MAPRLDTSRGEHHHAAEGVSVAAQVRPHSVHQLVLGPRAVARPADNPGDKQGGLG